MFPHAYSWPNDPQTYAHDAPLYRVIYSPGGTTVPVTPASNSIPICSALPARYNYSGNFGNCSVPVNSQGAVFGVARLTIEDPMRGWVSNGKDWSCDLDQRGGNDTGVLCRWSQPPAGNCSPPVIDAKVTQSACGLIDSGTSLVSSSIKPNSMDTLFVEVTVSKVLNPVALTGISGCASSWTPVAQQLIHTDQGLVIWYTGKANTNSACQVTVTLANENPAELKVYDVPRAAGVETFSSDSGDFVYTKPNQRPLPSVGAGSATTSDPSDLMLGSILQVNQQPTPATYWVFWLTNSSTWPGGIHCEPNDNVCPTDDGTDWLPGHGPNSSNADAGHQEVASGSHRLQRPAQNLGSFAWGGVAIYVKLQ